MRWTKFRTGRKLAGILHIVATTALFVLSCHNPPDTGSRHHVPDEETKAPAAGFIPMLRQLAGSITGQGYRLQDITGFMDAGSCRPHQPNLWDTSLEATCRGYLTYIAYCENRHSKCSDNGSVSIDFMHLPDTLDLPRLGAAFGRYSQFNPHTLQKTYGFIFINPATGKKAELLAFCGEDEDSLSAKIYELRIIGPPGGY